MSDDGGMGATGGGADEDISLPKATVAKLVQECLPEGFTCAKDCKDLITDCCKEFVLAISSEANEICEKESKKTMLPEHIIAALKSLGFDSFVQDVETVLGDHKTLAKAEKVKKSNKNGASSGFTQEELAAQQEEMLAASKARYEAGILAAPVSKEDE